MRARGHLLLAVMAGAACTSEPDQVTPSPSPGRVPATKVQQAAPLRVPAKASPSPTPDYVAPVDPGWIAVLDELDRSWPRQLPGVPPVPVQNIPTETPRVASKAPRH